MASRCWAAPIRGYRVGVRLEGGREPPRQRHRRLGQPAPAPALDGGATDTPGPAGRRRSSRQSDRTAPALMLRGTTGAVGHGHHRPRRPERHRPGGRQRSRTWRTTTWRTTAAGGSTSSARAATPSSGTTPRAPGAARVSTADCCAAAILLREGSDSNTIADNDLTASSIGVLVTGPVAARRGRRSATWSTGTTRRSRRSSAFAARVTWNVSFLENRADSAAAGSSSQRLKRRAAPRQYGDRRATRGGIDVTTAATRASRPTCCSAARSASGSRPTQAPAARAAATGSTTTC